MKQWIAALLLGLGLTLSSHAAIKVMAIGDSMTEEYRFEFIFSAPSSTPWLDYANTKNWVEILAERRGADLDFGGYGDDLLEYADLRNSGYEYNWGIPGYDTNKWMDILDPGFNPAFLLTRSGMRSQYASMDVIVIFVGGNDVNFEYGTLYGAQAGDATATAFINNVIGNLGEIIDEIRDYNSTVPIVLANVPDLGATPDIIADHPVAAQRTNATAIVADLNVAVAALATARGATLAQITNLTDRILSPDPLYIGAHEMIKDADPDEDNRPHYLFCWKGLHPSTNGQSVIANTLLAAINTATGSSIPLLPDREVIEHLLGLDPDQPYKDWATTEGLTDQSMTADQDGDGIPNLGEYLLDLDPGVTNFDHLASFQDISGTPMMTLSYTPDTAAARLAEITVKQSSDLKMWQDVPSTSLIDMGSGQLQAQMPLSAGLGFFRMEFLLKP